MVRVDGYFHCPVCAQEVDNFEESEVLDTVSVICWDCNIIAEIRPLSQDRYQDTYLIRKTIWEPFRGLQSQIWR